MKIFYIYHSGFAIETKNYKLIFDYYTEPKKNSGDFNIENFIIDNKHIFVFSSHGHGDHLNKDILRWKENNPNIKYILSDDIKVDGEYIFVKEGDKLKIDGIEIKVFGSTDLGVSYFVKCDGKSFFHAGDLNWWAWSDDTPEEERYMRELYMEKLEKIEKEIREKIDFLFYPVDPRLEENSFLGVEEFIKRVKVENIVPMHMWDKYWIVENLNMRLKDKNVIKIEKNRSLIFIEGER